MNQTQTQSNTDDSNSEPTPPADPEVVLETTPSIRPPFVGIVATLLLGGIAIGYLFANPTTFGDPGTTEIGVNLVFILMVLGVIRLLFKAYLLTRTTYVVTTDAVRHEYSLLYRTFSRELPLSMVRSHELDRSRVETLFGIGSVAFLTGSVAQSPAYVRFEHIADPNAVREQVRNQLVALDS